MFINQPGLNDYKFGRVNYRYFWKVEFQELNAPLIHAIASSVYPCMDDNAHAHTVKGSTGAIVCFQINTQRGLANFGSVILRDRK